MIDVEPLVSTYGLLEVFKWDRMGDFQAIICQNYIPFPKNTPPCTWIHLSLYFVHRKMILTSSDQRGISLWVTQRIMSSAGFPASHIFFLCAIPNLIWEPSLQRLIFGLHSKYRGCIAKIVGVRATRTTCVQSSCLRDLSRSILHRYATRISLPMSFYSRLCLDIAWCCETTNHTQRIALFGFAAKDNFEYWIYFSFRIIDFEYLTDIGKEKVTIWMY